MIFLIVLLICVATVPNLGFYSLPSFLLISFAFLLFLKSCKEGLFNSSVDYDILLVITALGIPYYGGLYQTKDSLVFGQIIIFIALIAAYLSTQLKSVRVTKYFAVLVSGCYLSLSFWTIYHSPFPIVDTFVILKEAPIKLMAGLDPYAVSFTKIYPGMDANYFSYFPLSFILTLPFVLILNDPRVLTIFVNILGAMLILKILPENLKRFSVVYITAFLFYPRSFYILEHMYLDSVTVFFFILFAYAKVNKRSSLSTLALSLILNLKQDLIILAPLVLSKVRKRVLFIVPFMLIPIFFLWNPWDFINDVVLVYSPFNNFSPKFLSLSLLNFINQSFGTIPLWIYFLMVAALLVSYIKIFFSKKSVLIKLVTFLFVFNYFMYHSYFNHYFLVGQLIMLLPILGKLENNLT